jgi:hypothetical protein
MSEKRKKGDLTLESNDGDNDDDDGRDEGSKAMMWKRGSVHFIRRGREEKKAHVDSKEKD